MTISLTLGDAAAIVDECQKQDLLRNQAAYVLATAYHESDHLIKPIKEAGSARYLQSKPYYPFIGMGYVQVTWERNYKRVSTETGVDCVSNPEKLLDPEIAKVALVTGMKEGWFTNKKLSDYIDLKHSDYTDARKIINGTDRAQLIAEYAVDFEKLLLAAGYGVTV